MLRHSILLSPLSIHSFITLAFFAFLSLPFLFRNVPYDLFHVKDLAYPPTYSRCLMLMLALLSLML